jgi:hypothetical protein
MTSLRTLGFVLALPLCACGARTDESGLFERDAPAVTSRAAQPVPQASAPSPSAALSQTPAPSGCCSSIDEQEAAPISTPPDHPPPPEPARADAGTAPPPAANACFEYLGDWITCENAGWPNVEQTNARDLQSCMQLCQQRADCTAVTDYFWLGRPDLGCWLYTSTCNAPAGGAWQEEDGERQYRKTCATQ